MHLLYFQTDIPKKKQNEKEKKSHLEGKRRKGEKKKGICAGIINENATLCIYLAQYIHLEWHKVGIVYIWLAEMCGGLSAETELDGVNMMQRIFVS